MKVILALTVDLAVNVELVVHRVHGFGARCTTRGDRWKATSESTATGCSTTLDRRFLSK